MSFGGECNTANTIDHASLKMKDTYLTNALLPWIPKTSPYFEPFRIHLVVAYHGPLGSGMRGFTGKPRYSQIAFSSFHKSQNSNENPESTLLVVVPVSLQIWILCTPLSPPSFLHENSYNYSFGKNPFSDHDATGLSGTSSHPWPRPTCDLQNARPPDMLKDWANTMMLS